MILRAGLFERVSTEEQSRTGFSIQTQIDALEEYCKCNNIKIVDHYTDAGVSGGKPWKKRPELKRLIEDVESGKIDIILFTKLDRWFRNVTEYYKVQEILDKHGVTWRAIWEDYNTSTANGKFAVNIFLAVAENERLRTSERIKAVFENKAKNKEVCFGGHTPPLGYTVERDEAGKRRLIKDPETMEAIQLFWDTLKKGNAFYHAIMAVRDRYGLTRSRHVWERLRKNTIYCGIYNGIEDFCEPYIDYDTFTKLQSTGILKNTPSGRPYYFRGKLRCPVCGCKLIANGTKRNYGYYLYYRCRKAYVNCDYNGVFVQRDLETQLLARLDEFLTNTITSVEISAKTDMRTPKQDIKRLRERLRKLNIIYINGNMSDGDYLAQQTEINKLIQEAENVKPTPQPNVEELRQLLQVDFNSIYASLTVPERQQFWNRLIKQIDVDTDKNITNVIFNV